MKSRPKKPLSPLQRSRLVKILLILACAALLWIVFAPNMGLLSVKRENDRLQALQQKKAQLEQENAALRQEIERIQNDIEYFEQLAREKHGLLKKNEMIFDFSKGEADRQ